MQRLRTCFKLVIVGALLLPLSLRAQLRLFQPFRPGSYVLAADSGVRHTGQLRMPNGSLLEVKDAAGQVLKLKPADVRSVRLAAVSYRTARPFTIDVPGFDIKLDEGAFVELADSGQVLLLRYTYQTGGPVTSTGPGGTVVSSGGGEAYYLLQRPADAYPTVLPSKYYGGAGPAFYAALRPFLAGRPDLEALVDRKRITILHIPRMIHALNTGQPYVPRRLN